MVDLTITPASVLAGSNANRESGLAGETLLAGKLVCKDPADNKYKLVDTNAVNVDLRRPRGVALNGASLNQPVFVQTSGDITIGGTMVAGDAFYASDTPGGICPRADVGATENVVLVGMAKSTTLLGLDIQITGVTL